MTSRPSLRSLAVFTAILFLLSPVPIRADGDAQENTPAMGVALPEIDALAARIAEKLSKTGQKIVAVASFSPQKSSPHGFGSELSDRVRSALAKTGGGIQVFDNARLIGALQHKKWMAIDIYDPLVFRSIANVMGVKETIEGHYKVAGEFIELSIEVVNTADDKKIGDFKAKLPVRSVTPKSDTLVRDPLTNAFLDVGGVSSPGCKYCPQPGFSPDARAKNVSKAVAMLRVTVCADGRATDIRLVRPAGYGLDQNAAQAVEGWEFIPGHLPDGTAVPTRVDIEVTFTRR